MMPGRRHGRHGHGGRARPAVAKQAVLACDHPHCRRPLCVGIPDAAGDQGAEGSRTVWPHRPDRMCLAGSSMRTVHGTAVRHAPGLRPSWPSWKSGSSRPRLSLACSTPRRTRRPKRKCSVCGAGASAVGYVFGERREPCANGGGGRAWLSARLCVLDAGNTTGSPGFERFLDMLGERTRLKGWTHFRAGLDVQCTGARGRPRQKRRCTEVLTLSLCRCTPPRRS